MRLLGRVFALLVFLASSGCAVIEQERTNRGGYLDYVLDQNWMKANSKGMRALRAFAIEVSLARIASISAKNESDRQLLAVRIGALTKRFIPIYLCAFDTNPLGVAGAENDPCFYYDSAMVEYANGLFDLAMVALPKEDAKKLFDMASGAFVSPVNILDLLNALFAIARDAVIYGRTIGGLYRDSVELEVQLWITTPAIDDRPPPGRVTLDDIADLQAIYSQRNDNMAAWLGAIAVLRARGLEPLPQRKFFGELGGLLRYICDQITQDKPTADQCKYGLPTTLRPPLSVLSSHAPIRIGDEVRRFVVVSPSGPGLGTGTGAGSGSGSSTSNTGTKVNIDTGGQITVKLTDVTAAIAKTRDRIPKLIALFSRVSETTFSNQTAGDIGKQIVLALTDIDTQLKRASPAVTKLASLKAEYEEIQSVLGQRITTIQLLADAVAKPNANKAEVAKQIILQVQGSKTADAGQGGLKGADQLVTDALVVINKAAAGG